MNSNFEPQKIIVSVIGLELEARPTYEKSLALVTLGNRDKTISLSYWCDYDEAPCIGDSLLVCITTPEV